MRGDGETLFSPLQVFAFGRIYPDFFPCFDEAGDLYDQAHFQFVQDGLFDAILGAEAVLDHGSRAQVAQLGLHESPQIARRAVKNAEYGKQISVVLDDNAWM